MNMFCKSEKKEDFPIFKLFFLFLIMFCAILYQFYIINNLSEELKTTRIVISTNSYQ